MTRRLDTSQLDGGYAVFTETEATADVLAEVAHERTTQDARWGQQNHPDGTSAENADYAAHVRATCQQAAAEGRVTWAHILTEEVGEAFAETNPAKLRAELLQVAAVAAAWVEAIDRRADLGAVSTRG